MSKNSILLALLHFIGVLPMSVYSQRIDCAKNLVVNEKFELVIVSGDSGKHCNIKIRYDAQNRPIEIKKQAGNSNCRLPGLDVHRLSITYDIDKEIWTPTNNSDLPSAINIPCGTLNGKLIKIKNGTHTQIIFQDFGGNPTTLAFSNIARLQLDENSDGQLTSLEYRDLKNLPTSNNLGISRETRKYQDGKLVEIERFDANGDPLNAKYRAFRTEITYGTGGRWSTERYFDPNGQLMLAGPEIAHKLDRFYDETGQIRRSVGWKYDPEGGSLITKLTRTFDARSNCLREVVLKFGDGAADSMVTQIIHRRFNSEDLLVEDRTWGPDSIPVVFIPFRNNYEYDDCGNLIREERWDAQGSPFQSMPENAAIHLYKWDSDSRKIEDSRMRTEGVFHADETGIATRKWWYDDDGNLLCQAFYDENQMPASNEKGVFMIRFHYDVSGREIKVACLAPNGKRTNCGGGYAIRTREYAKNGELLAEVYLDQDSALTPNSRGWAAYRREIDEKGNLLEEAWYNQYDELVMNPESGFAKQNFSYDNSFRPIRETFLNSFGGITQPSGGYFAFREMKYDRRGRLIEESTYNTDGKLVPDEKGCARRTWNYKKGGSIVFVNCFDALGHHVDHSESKNVREDDKLKD